MNRRSFFRLSSASLGLVATTPSYAFTATPPAQTPSLSPALMKGFHEECLRLSAKALQSQLTAQDVNEASLWFGMVGQHFQETNFDSAIRTVATAAINQMQITSASLDNTWLETELSKEISSRLGSNAESQIRPLFNSTFDEDMLRMHNLATTGLSSSFINISRLLGTSPIVATTAYYRHREQPSLMRTGYLGYQGSSDTPIPPVRPPLISVCSLLNTTGNEATDTSALLLAYFQCQAVNPINAEICADIITFGAAGALMQLISMSGFC